MNQSTIESNYQIYERLSRLVVDQFLMKDNLIRQETRIDYGPLEINDFSVSFGINALRNSGLKGIYVKIPKVDLCLNRKREIMPLTEKDREFAEQEYQSLLYLSQFWQAEDLGISFVKPLGFLPEYNALITERVFAQDIFKTFRHWDLLQRLKSGIRSDLMHTVLCNIGVALARLHCISATNCLFCAEETFWKIKYYCSQLKSFHVGSRFLDMVVDRLKWMKNSMTPTQLTNTFKGLDIRNILIDQHKKIFILDPGRMKEDFKEADLARFIVTCRILYWGSVWFFLHLYPQLSYEESFLQGYYGDRERPAQTLSFLIIKELVKHWHWAYIVLQIKWRWPSPLKHFLKQTYINPFYRRQIMSEVIHLEQYI